VRLTGMVRRPALFQAPPTGNRECIQILRGPLSVAQAVPTFPSKLGSDSAMTVKVTIRPLTGERSDMAALQAVLESASAWPNV